MKTGKEKKTVDFNSPLLKYSLKDLFEKRPKFDETLITFDQVRLDEIANLF